MAEQVHAQLAVSNGFKCAIETDIESMPKNIDKK
jgi:hypothetical protein